MAINRKPVIYHNGLPFQRFEENGEPVLLSPSLLIVDWDSPMMHGAMVRIALGYQIGADTLTFTPVGGISGSFDAATGILTLSGAASRADYQAVLRSVAYQNTSDNPGSALRSITFGLDDGYGMNTLSGLPVSVSVTSINDAPEVTADPTLVYVDHSATEFIDPDLVLVDPDSRIDGAVVQITANYVRGEDVLGFTVTGDIRGTFDAARGAVVLHGSGTPEQYQQVLRSITYRNASDEPSLATRIISIQVEDSRGASSSIAEISVIYSAPPVVTVSGAPLAYTEGDAALTLDATLTISDIDDPDLTGATVSISAGFTAGDQLLFTDTGSISGSYDPATGVLTLTGGASVADYQAALRSVQFQSSSEDPGTGRTISWVVTDDTDPSDPVSTVIEVTPVNDAPGLAISDTLAYTENDAASVIAPAATLGDVDSADFNGGSLTVSLTANGSSADQLAVRHEGTGAGQIGVSGSDISYGGTVIGSFSGGANGSDLVITFSSSAATPEAVQALARSITFENTSDDPSTLARTVGFTLVDGDGGTDSATASATVNVTSVNDAPALAPGGDTPVYTEDGSAVVLDAALAVSDLDDANLEGATVSISANFQSGDALVFVDTAEITGSYDSGTGVLTLTGTATVAQYQAALRSITFQTTQQDPLAGKTITWEVSDGTDGSVAADSSLSITAVNDAPELTIGDTLAYTENDAASVIAPGAGLTEPDSDDYDGGSLTVSFTANGSSADQLAVRHEGTGAGQIGVSGSDVSYGGVVIGSFSGGANGSDLVITFSSSAATPEAVQALARSITFENTSDSPSTLARTVGFTLVDGDGGTDSATASATVNVTSVNDIPSVTAGGGGAAYTEGGSAVAVDPGLTLADADNANLQGATASISGNFQAGDELVFVDTAEISGSYDSGTGVLTLTGTATVAQYQAALRSVTFQTTRDDPTTGKTVSWEVSDGTDGSDPVSTGIDITPVNDAPELAISDTLAYTENDAASVIAPAATPGDVDSADFNGGSLTVSFTANGSSADQLAVRHEGTGAGQIGVSGSDISYGGTVIGSFSGGANGSDLVITFSSSAATPAAVQALARSITFENTSDDPSALARTVGFTLVDGDGGTDSATASATVDFTPVNDAPTVTTSGGDAAYTEGGSAVAVDGAITLSDLDDATFASATVQITGGYDGGNDLLAFTGNGATGNIAAGAFDAGTGTLTLTSAGGTATTAEWQAALRLVTYDTASNSPGASRTVTFQLDDGNGANNLSNAATRDIAITEVNSAPSVTTSGGASAFTEDGGSVAVDNALTVADPDTATLTGATVSITTGFASGEDLLSYTGTGSISGSYDSATGVLTLSGSGTLAEYQQVLRSVTYDNSSDTPSTTSRVLEFVVDDGQSVDNLSTVATKTVSVAASNDAPELSISSTVTFTEGDTHALIAPAATVADPDSGDFGGGSLTVSLGGTYQSGDTLGMHLSLPGWGVSGGSIAYNGAVIAGYSGGSGGNDLVLSLTADATPALVQDLVRMVMFYNGSQNPATSARTVSFALVDGDGGADTDTATATVNVSAVNDAPSLAGGAGTALAYTENDAATVLEPALTLSDVDSSTLAGATVTISSNYQNGEDLLDFTAVGGISGSFDAATGVLTLSGTDTLANYQAALRSVTYANGSDDPGTATRTISFQVDDGGSANDLSNTLTRDVEVTSVNDAPAITAGGSISFTENDAATAVRSTLALSDAEGDSITGATVTISANYASGEDLLSFTPSGSITGSFDAGTGVLTLSGTGSAADYQAALQSVTYANGSEAPTAGARTITFAATDANGDTSTGASTTVNVTAVNDAPVTTVPADAAVGTAFSNTALAIAGVSVSDVDAGSGSIQTVVSAANGSLTFNLAGGAGATDNGTGSVTLTGTVAEVNAALATLSYRSDDGFTGADTISVLTSDLGNTGTGGALESNGGVASTFQVGVVPQVFVIDNSNATADDASAGTAANPFNSIASFNSLAGDGAGDYIYIHNGSGTYSEASGLTLLNNQQVWGQGQTLQFTNPVTGEVVTIGTGSGGTTPTLSITGASNAGITLAQGNTLTGFNVATTHGSQTGVRDGNGTVGSLTINDVDVTGTGMAVDIDQGGALNVAFGTLSSSGSSTQGVQLAGTTLSGSFSASTGAISGSTSAGFQVGDGAGTANTGGTVAISYGGTIATTGNARVVDIQDRGAGADTISLSGNLSHGSGAGAGVFIDDVAGGAITLSGTGTFNTGTANGIAITDVTGGSVTLSGSLDIDTSSGTGILLSGNTAAVNFTGSQITVNTTAGGTGVSIANNSGAVGFNNAGNGLDIVTANGTGFTASNSGTLTIQGTSNTIATTGAVGLNVANTTIGAADLNFVSISASGGANGIVLNNTGSTGSLTVTGSGTAGSGGTIQNTSGDGIDVTSGMVNLAYMIIQNVAGHGIDASNLLGSNTLASSSISGFDNGGVNTENGLNIVNSGSSTLGSLTVSNSTFTGSATSNDGIFMEAQGSGNMTLTVTGSTFQNMYGDGMDIQSTLSSSGTVRLTVSGSSFINAQAGTGNGGLQMDPYGNVNFIADINGNTFQDIIDHVVTLGAIGVTNGATADADITIRNNTISSNLGGRGITITADGGTTDLLIDNNSIDSMGTSSSYAIVTNFTGIGGLDPAATGNVTISNNDIGQNGPLWTSDGLGGAIWLNAQAGSTMHAALFNNVVDINTASVIEAVWIRSIGGSTLNLTAMGNDIDDTAGTSVEMNVQAGLSTTQAGTVNLNMTGNNLNTGELRLTENSLGTINITQPDAGALSTLNGNPTVSAMTGSASYGASTPPTPSTPSLPLWIDPASALPAGDVPDLSASDLASIVEAALHRWETAGLTASQLQLLDGVVFAIADLDAGFVSASAGNLVLIDLDAAGRGWFVDATPMDDLEFAAASGSRLVAPVGPASQGLDLLTAVMHEIGHTLGLGDAYGSSDADSLMYGLLTLGERRLPEADSQVQLVGSHFDLNIA